MVVNSGQMPYRFDSALPIRAPTGAWPGLFTPTFGPSGNIIESAMFVYNAENRKWRDNSTEPIESFDFLLYTHPDITPSGFEPKTRGETLVGLVGGRAGIINVSHIEEMRNRMSTLFSAYAVDSVYESRDFFLSWFNTAYPESPSGSLIIFQISPPIPVFALLGTEFLRPPITEVTDGNFIETTDLHWLGGSGTLFDIDFGEVIFNPFPFPREHFDTAPSTNNLQFEFGPVYPLVQTTLGTLPSIVASRYQSDIAAGTFKQETNFEAIGSGYVQIDGYGLIADTIIELVKGNDTNFDITVAGTNDYTGHVQGLRVVRGGLGFNDVSARCYRLPTAQTSGLYRLLVHNQKSNVPFTAIPSGIVSLWPQGQVRKIVNDGSLYTANSNFIDGRQYSSTSDGGLSIDATAARGVHVCDDAIWLAAPAVDGSGTFDSRGLFVLSPYTGHPIWYRPAERVVATLGNVGDDPGIFGVQLGMFKIGTDIVRLSKSADQTFTFNATPVPDTGVYSIYWQLYDEVTLDHTSSSTSWTFEGDDVTMPQVDDIRGSIRSGSSIYVNSRTNQILRFTTGLSFDGFFLPNGPGIAARRHIAGGSLLYTIAGSIQVGDPLFSTGGGITSGIGKWGITVEPGGITTDSGEFEHFSAKRLRAETFFGHRALALIHSIFDVAGSTHVSNGTWMLIQFSSGGAVITNAELFLCRIVEEATEWRVVQVYRTGIFLQVLGNIGIEFPAEAILQDIN